MEIFNKEKFIKQRPVSITKDNENMWQRMSAFNFDITHTQSSVVKHLDTGRVNKREIISLEHL